MATKTTNPVDPETGDTWEDVKVGMGREWDLEHDGTLEGIFVGSGEKEVEDKQNGGTRMTAFYQFEVDNGEDKNRFIWGSYQIDEGMKQYNFGDTARITYLGKDEFTGNRGPQQVKNYRFQRKAAPTA